jgi:hypothetical protein
MGMQVHRAKGAINQRISRIKGNVAAVTPVKQLFLEPES